MLSDSMAIYTIPKQESLGGMRRDDIIHTRLPHFGRTMVSLIFQRSQRQPRLDNETPQHLQGRQHRRPYIYPPLYRPIF